MNDVRFAFRQLRKSTGFVCVTIFTLGLPGAQLVTHAAEIPIKRDSHLILLEVRVNDAAPCTFALGSGASHTVLDTKYARELGLKIESAAPTTGTGKGQITTETTAPVRITASNTTFEVHEPWIIDLSNVPIPKTVKGLVGSELFQKLIVKIDPNAATISVCDPATFEYSGPGTSIPLSIEKGKLYLEAQLEVPAGQFANHKLRIDTGSDSSVNDEIVRQSEETRRANLGNGLGENFEAVSGVFTSVKIGPHLIHHVWGPGGAPASIGMELLRRFVITFDLPHGRLYLEPTPALSEPVPTPP